MLAKYLQLFINIFGKRFLKHFFDFEIDGVENIKNLNRPVIIVSNHASYFDFLIVGVVICQNKALLPIRFATFYIYYYLLFPIMFSGGAFPVSPGVGIDKTLKKGIVALEKGKGTVMIFPEGKVRTRGRPRKARRGAAYMALKTDTLIVPVVLDGIVGLNFWSLFDKSKKVTAKIGKPYKLDVNEFDWRFKTHLNEASKAVTESIRA